MNDLAAQLKEAIKNENLYIYEMLSPLGKKLYYPKGILSQSSEAIEKANRFNATIGIATEENEPMYFQHIQEHFMGYDPKDIYPYAPPAGKQELRTAWKEKIIKDNPNLRNEVFGLPIVTNALTHGLSIAADLFTDIGDSVLVPDKYWGNYQSIFHIRRGANLITYPLFNDNGEFDVSAFKDTLFKQKTAGKAVVLLNFPNNPTGYSPYSKEVEGIITALYEAAQEELNIVVILDDAYFGLFYEDSVKESLFGYLSGLHPRILPIKIDGATKENYVWGLRVGFITFASESPVILEALEQKTKGLIRGTVSSGSHLSQTVILKSLQSKEFDLEKQQKYKIMERRAKKVIQVLNQEKYNNYWSCYPFNSGYFMCLQLKTVDAEELRVHLLNQYGVGTIAINSTDLRIAFSCVEERNIEELFDLIYKGIKDLLAFV
ncbi:aminotransferase class I/II-fold pyridoxal phosphate-dependent enzyme [Bacillus sp. FSL K6-3431]|uniref:aminotransferase class I/II-fold pyridoxal phosphate-dependent enzyme n=1 Tax=Bacillus sp. FSL K6-3431 TaxID=2921500 RepID=UPI0030F6F905